MDEPEREPPLPYATTGPSSVKPLLMRLILVIVLIAVICFYVSLPENDGPDLEEADKLIEPQ